MKNKWLLLSLIILVSVYLNNTFKVIFGSITILYWILRFNDKTVILLVVLLFLVNISRFQKHEIIDDYYTVEKINAYSTVLKSKNRLYKTKKLDVDYDDKIVINGSVNDLTEDYHFYGLTNKSYYYSNFIFQQITVDSYKIIEKGNTLRNKLWQKIKNSNEENQSFYKSIIFQYNDDSLEVNDNLQSLIYSSGVHLSATINFIYKIFNYLITERICDLLLIFLLLVSGFKTRFSCSLIRIILRCVLKKIDNKSDRLGMLIIFLLLINKYFAYSMSFLVPISLSLVNVFTNDKNKLTKFIALIPVQLSLNYKFNFIDSFLYQYVRQFYLFIYFLSLFCLLFNVSIWPLFISKLLKLIESNKILELSGKPSTLFLIIFIKYGIDYLNTSENKNLIILVVLLVFNQYQSLFYPFESITFLNVNHGDCFIYQPAFSMSCLMIDTGSSFNYSKVENFLNGKGIRRIDTLVLTHDDSDHVGNLEKLEKDYHIRNIIRNKTEEINYHNKCFFGLLFDKEYEDDNSNSQIIYTNINGLSYLFMADGTIQTEKEILRYYPNLKVDVLKLGHHGSNTSSSIDFLSEIYPKLAIISCGDYEIFHHPHINVVENLTNLNIPFLTTNTNGDIKIISLIYHNLLLTAKGEYAIIKALK